MYYLAISKVTAEANGTKPDAWATQDPMPHGTETISLMPGHTLEEVQAIAQTIRGTAW